MRCHHAGTGRRPLVLLLALAIGLAVVTGLTPAARAAVAAPGATVLGPITDGLGRCLENRGNAATVNNRVQGAACARGAPAQQFSRLQLALRTSRGQCLEPFAGRVTVGTAVVATTCSAAPTQQWQPVSGVLYHPRSRLCLQLQSTATAILIGCNTRAPAQRWTVPAASTPDPPRVSVTPTTAPVPSPVPTPVPSPLPTPTSSVPPPGAASSTTAPAVPPVAGSSPLLPLPPVLPGSSAPTTTPVPVRPPFVQAGTTVWAADLGKADVVKAGFVDRPSNRQLADGVWNNPTLPWPIPTVAAPAGRAGRAVAFTVPDQAIRLEAEPNHRVFVEGDDDYFGFAFRLGADFPLDTTGWQVIEQLHGAPGTGSPPVSFQAAKGGLLLDGGANKPGATSPGQYAYQKRLMDLQKERWYNVVYRVTFSADPARSWVTVWVDGQPVLTDFQPPCATVYPPTTATDRPGTYRKQGIYHFKEIPGGTIHMAGQKLGTGYDAADPAR